MVVKVEGELPVVSGSTNLTVASYSITNPSLDGFYVFSSAALTGVVGPNTYMTLYNPVGSGKTIAFGGAFVSMVASAATSKTVPMRGHRFSGAPTGGTVQPSSSVGKFVSTYPNSVAEVRLGNPTVTLGAALWNTPPAVTTGVGGGQFIHAVNVPPGAGSFTLAPGEGLAVNCQDGGTGQVWNISLVWGDL